MYGKGLSTRDMPDIIADIYGFEISSETISCIIDNVQPRIEDWQNRQLKNCIRSSMWTHCMYNVRVDGKARKKAIYAIVGMDTEVIRMCLSTGYRTRRAPISG
ncbi:MAG: transposase [Ethanoligenens sp.]